MKCPYCQSKRMVKAGRSRARRARKNYDRQRYMCNNCHRFTVNPIKGK